jgi:hypothetical protein
MKATVTVICAITQTSTNTHIIFHIVEYCKRQIILEFNGFFAIDSSIGYIITSTNTVLGPRSMSYELARGKAGVISISQKARGKEISRPGKEQNPRLLSSTRSESTYLSREE